MNGTIAIAVPEDTSRAEAVLRHGRMLARGLGMSWIALFVATRPRRSRQQIATLAAVVAAQGGELHHVIARDVATGIAYLARECDASVLMLAPSRRPRLLRLLVRGTTERILDAVRTLAIAVPKRGTDA